MIGQAKRLNELYSLRNDNTGRRNSRIVAFTSGKGGTGKTFLSLNMAYALVNEGKKVLYVDLDTNLSNANILLNEYSEKSITNFYAGENEFEEIISKIEPNFYLVFGDSDEITNSSFVINKIGYLFTHLNNIKKQFDVIILDTGAGAGEEVIKIILNSDYSILVTTPEPTAIMDAYVILKILNSQNYKGDKFVIVNKCFEKSHAQTAYENLNTAAGHFLNDHISFLGSLDFNNSVSRSIISQKLLLKFNPADEMSCKIKQLAAKFYEITQLANIQQV